MWRYLAPLRPIPEHYQMESNRWLYEPLTMSMHSKFQWFSIRFCFPKKMFITLLNIFSSNHLVNIRTEVPLPMGQRIYVFGNLSSKPFSLDDGRLRQKLIVKSKYMRLRGQDQSLHTKDQNSIKMLAKISSDIRHTEKYCLFTLTSTHSPKYVTNFLMENIKCYSCIYTNSFVRRSFKS